MPCLLSLAPSSILILALLSHRLSHSSSLPRCTHLPHLPHLQYACELADASSDAIPALVHSIAAREGISLTSGPALVFLGVDTRPSSPSLMARVAAGAQAMGAAVQDHGRLTTPQLHHIVRMHNFPILACGGRYSGEAGYYRMLVDGFHAVTSGVRPETLAARGTLHMDCAHGVGGPQATKLATAFSGLVSFQLSNKGETPEESAYLNEGVGAEHVQKGRLPPAGFTSQTHMGSRCASLDGDADRLVYFTFQSPSGTWKLLDGDKIAVLCAAWLADTLRAAGFTITGTPAHAHGSGHHTWSVPASTSVPSVSSLTSLPVSVGIVQTAYANGASTDYVRDTLKLPALFAKTGVKYVHHAAAEFDVGVYFEANGHGTVLMHPAFLERLAAVSPSAISEGDLQAAVGVAAAAALRKLHGASLLINQAIGDALSDSMFVEAALSCLSWSVYDWDSLYEDVPSRQCKLAVQDRTAITTIEDESRVLQPKVLQDAIDALVSAVPRGRAFVRPSGTEDVVRVYAEAASQEQADALACAVAQAAYDHAGGVGARPTSAV